MCKTSLDPIFSPPFPLCLSLLVKYQTSHLWGRSCLLLVDQKGTDETVCIMSMSKDRVFLSKSCSGWASCHFWIIFYAFALHALSDTNRQLTCICVCVCVEGRWGILQRKHFPTWWTSLLPLSQVIPLSYPVFVCFFLFSPQWTMSIYVSATHLCTSASSVHSATPSLRLLPPRGYVCTVGFTKYIHVAT